MLTAQERPILIVNLIYIPAFTLLALRRGSGEFLLYVVVIVVVAGLILANQQRVRFDRSILWGLTVWGLVHMAGGTILVGNGVLYDVKLVRVFPRLHILRYDQVVHGFGFGVATLVCYHLLRPYLKPDIPKWRTLGFLIVLMGSGLGAINEIVEFVAVLTMEETGVGGYDNTMCDLVFNLLGGTAAAVLIVRRQKGATEPGPA